MTSSGHHLKVLPLAVAFGIAGGIGLLLAAWAGWLLGGWGGHFVQVVSSLHFGYDITFLGGLIGFAWGFVDWFIGGLIIAWIYNGCCKCCKKCDIQP